MCTYFGVDTEVLSRLNLQSYMGQIWNKMIRGLKCVILLEILWGWREEGTFELVA